MKRNGARTLGSPTVFVLLLFVFLLPGCMGQAPAEGKVLLALPTASAPSAALPLTPTLPATPTSPLLQLAASNHPWTMVGGGPHRFRRTTVDGPHGAAQVAWTLDVGGTVLAEPVVSASGTVYVVTREGVAKAIDSDGSQLWRYSDGDPIFYAPALSESGMLYVVTGKPGRTGAVVALDAASGEQQWRYLLSQGYGPTAPMIADAEGNLILAVGRLSMYQSPQPGYLLSLTPDGSERWMGLANVPFAARIVVDGYGRVWVGGTRLFGPTTSDVLWLLDPADGLALETLRPGGSPYVSPSGEPYYWEVRFRQGTDEHGNQIQVAEQTPYQLQVSPQGAIVTQELEESTARRWGGGSVSGQFLPVGEAAGLQYTAWDGSGWAYGYLWDDTSEPEALMASPRDSSSTESTDYRVTVAGVNGQEVLWQIELVMSATDESDRGDISEPSPSPVTPPSLGRGCLYLSTFGGLLYAICESR